MKFGCCCCGADTDAWPPLVKPPVEPPPVLLVGDAHGSLGVGAAVGDPLGASLLDMVGSGLAELSLSFAAAVGLPLPSGSGSDDAVGVPLADGVAVDDGDALDCRPHNALETGSVDGEELADGVALPDGSASGDGLPDGSAFGFGPPPPEANAVAVADAKRPTAAALNATDFRFMGITSVPDPLPGSALAKRTSG